MKTNIRHYPLHDIETKPFKLLTETQHVRIWYRLIPDTQISYDEDDKIVTESYSFYKPVFRFEFWTGKELGDGSKEWHIEHLEGNLSRDLREVVYTMLQTKGDDDLFELTLFKRNQSIEVLQ